MYVDLTPLLGSLRMDPLLFAAQLRSEVRTRTGGCCCSVGLGPNLLLARLANQRAKPDGQFLAGKEGAEQLVRGTRVRDLPGVGRSLEARLEALGAETCGDIQRFTLGQLQVYRGRAGGISWSCH